MQNRLKEFSAYAELANLPALLPKEEYEKLHLLFRAGSESLYRVGSLIAFGIGLASYKDIRDFVQFDRLETEDGHGQKYYQSAVRIVLPWAPTVSVMPLPEKLEWKQLLSFSQENELYGPIYCNPFTCPDGSTTYVVSCLLSNRWVDRVLSQKRFEEKPIEDILLHPKNLKVLKTSLKDLGQTIANAYARGNFVGIFNKKPLYQPSNLIDSSWQDLVSLTDKQLPGICPVCGKVVDRRTGSRGGQPKMACLEHAVAFQNEKTRLKDSDDPDMKYKDKLAMKAREMRWRHGMNQRPLMFSGVEVL